MHRDGGLGIGCDPERPKIGSRRRRPFQVRNRFTGSKGLLPASLWIPEEMAKLRRKAGRVTWRKVGEAIRREVLFDAWQPRADGGDTEAGQLEDLVG